MPVRFIKAPDRKRGRQETYPYDDWITKAKSNQKKDRWLRLDQGKDFDCQSAAGFATTLRQGLAKRGCTATIQCHDNYLLIRINDERKEEPKQRSSRRKRT